MTDTPSDDQFTRDGRVRVDDQYDQDRADERLEDLVTAGQPVAGGETPGAENA